MSMLKNYNSEKKAKKSTGRTVRGIANQYYPRMSAAKSAFRYMKNNDFNVNGGSKSEQTLDKIEKIIQSAIESDIEYLQSCTDEAQNYLDGNIEGVKVTPQGRKEAKQDIEKLQGFLEKLTAEQ